ncbi:hypothetical protein BDY21DRAFT_341493 [Lineolata rhizophorae]|uniref:Uncharacterized protein n=1 Tax=Lineolata rhizophorae TaxID=578093 RepID=A0A6A6P2U6_9PEZI|nr:hypothetical protein BDY21DRAFT_341493 [Lineolata rhizophorae]
MRPFTPIYFPAALYIDSIFNLDSTRHIKPDRNFGSSGRLGVHTDRLGQTWKRIFRRRSHFSK